MKDIVTNRRQFLKTTASVAAGTAAIGLSMPAIVRAQAAPISFRVSSAMGTDPYSAQYFWFDHFQKLLTDAVGDKLKMDYFPNSQLGKEADVVQQVKAGSIDMMLTGSSIWATAIPEFGMLDLGFLFDSYDHGAKALTAGVGTALGDLLKQRTGVSVLGWSFHFGARSVYTKKPVNSLEDLKNVKIRVLPAPAFIKTFETIGVIPTPIPFNEVYTALQTGVVDGFEHDAATALSSKYYEVTKHCYMTEHLFSPMCIFMGKRGMSKIPADLLPAFIKAVDDTCAYQQANVEAKGRTAINELQKLGVTFVPMPAEERKSTQEKMAKEVWEPFAERYPITKEAFAKIAATRG